MVWIKKKVIDEKIAVAGESFKASCFGGEVKEIGRKGRVPLLVGDDEGSSVRFWVELGVLKEPIMEKMLEMAVKEFGYAGQRGVLRIPCDAAGFRRALEEISIKKAR